MKKKFTFLIAALMLLTMINLPGAAWATTDQVTSQTATNNGEYVIAIYYNGDYYALPKASTMSSATTYDGTKLTLNSLGKVNTSDASDITWKLVENSNTSGQFYIQQTINNTTYYLYKNGTTSSTNYNIKTVTSGQHYWTFAQQSNTYQTYTVKSERGSACLYLTNTASTSTFSVRGSTNSYITLLAVGDAAPCTVTLGDDNTQLTETSAGAGVTLPSRSDVSPYTFAGWITDNITTETTTAPATIIPADTYYPTSNITLYPVYTRTEGGGTTTEWHLTELADADEGVYALLSSGNKAFNGTISSGHGQSTSDAFSFTNGVATTAPTGLCEITLVGVTGGYKMYNSSKGYLYGAAASSGNLAWHDDETSFWFYTNSNWIYNTTVYLRSYNDTFRTYNKASNNEIKLAKKVTVSTGTTYYISVVSTGAPTIVASNVDILYSATSGSIEYNIIDEPDPAGTLSAAVKAGTTSTIANLVFGTITDNEVSFSCNANDAFSEHTAIVTLTYTYGNDETATKDVTITQAATPIVLSSITLSGTYPIEFIQDDAFSSTGIVVTAHYNDESSSDVTSSATCSGYDMSTTGEQTITVSYTESGVTKTATYTITVNAIPNKTIAQFISDEGGKCYLTGTVSKIVNTTYGNFDLTDESGTIYVYGCLTTSGQSGQFESLNIVADDIIKVLANEYIYYNSTTHEAKNVKFVEKIVPNPQTLTVIATNGSVEIAGKTLDNGSCEVNEGASVTATATPSNHYTFASWTAEGVALADATANPLTFTMPTNGVTLTANFTENAKHNATFYVLGVEYGTDANVYEGSAITFPSVTAPNGYTFMGWTTAAIVGSQNNAPATLVTAANMGNANINYYAVFAIQTGSIEGTADLTNAEIKNYKSNNTTSYSNEYSIDNWTGRYLVNVSSNTYFLQLGYNSSTNAGAYNSHLTTPECPYNITSITISTNNNTASGRTFYLCSASNLGTASSENATYGSGSITEANGSVTINLSSNTKQFHIYPNGTAYIESVSLIYSNATYSSYCTTITYTSYENEETRETPISANEIVTVQDGAILTLNAINSGTAANLIIEDGGILITHNAVEATVQKNITGVGAENWAAESGAAGWYFIASPVNGADFNTATTGNYDLYSLDWAEKWWRNIKKSENEGIFAAGFQRGTGYLYASKDGNTLSVAGEIQPLSNEDKATVTLATTGWNLIGNPLTCKVAVDCPFDELTKASAVTTREAGNIINPCQGIAVWGNAGTTVTFTKAESQNAAAPSNNSIQMTLAQNIVNRGSTNSTKVDNAIISFNKSNGLPKFPMLEGNAKLYIPVNHEQYAIVSCETQGEMPVCFKAVTDGQYTISVKPEGVEVSYLHLIDNIAGTDIDLLATPGYTFNAKGDDYESRFRLVFSAKSDNDTNLGEDFAFFSNGSLIVTDEGTLQVVDMMGRVISSEMVNGSTSKTIDAKAGVYVLRLIQGSDVKTQKIVVR